MEWSENELYIVKTKMPRKIERCQAVFVYREILNENQQRSTREEEEFSHTLEWCLLSFLSQTITTLWGCLPDKNDI